MSVRRQSRLFRLVTDKKQYYANGVWSWGGESIDPDTGNLYAGVGNSLGKLGETGQYSDSVIELTHSLKFVADEQPESDLKNDLDIGTTPVLYKSGGSRCAAFERKDGSFFTIDRTHLQNGNFGSKLNLGGNLATAAYSSVARRPVCKRSGGCHGASIRSRDAKRRKVGKRQSEAAGVPYHRSQTA